MGLTDDADGRLRHGPVSPERAREMQRGRILDAMVAEVGERGLRSVTIAAVCTRAGVSRSTFYELFKDLDTCVLAVLRQVASRSTALMAKAFADKDNWQDGVLAALAALLESLDREPLLARVCLLEMLAGSPAVLKHRARELAALNPLVDMGRKQARANGEPVELAAEASVASVAGILHTRLVTGEAPPFIGLLGQLVGLVVCPYLEPHEVVREVKCGESLAQAIAKKHASSSSPPSITVQLPAALSHPGAYRARSCMTFIAANPGSSNKQIAAGIDVPHLGQVSELLARLARGGMLCKHAGGAGRPNQWWLTPQGEQIAQALATTRPSYE
jgi:AcrR family transcriptional regulator